MAATAPTIVYDLDGTLVDSAADLIAALNVVGASHRLAPFSLAEGLRLVGAGARVMIERGFAVRGRPLLPGESEALLTEFLAHYRAHMVDQSRSYPGVAAAIDRFAKAGWLQAVCTNKQEAFARDMLERLGLADRFAAITGPDTFGARKPDPRTLIETIRVAGGAPRHAVMVGDSETDAETAHAAGIPLVAVSFGYRHGPVAGLRAAQVIDRFADLWDAVATLSIVRNDVEKAGA